MSLFLSRGLEGDGEKVLIDDKQKHFRFDGYRASPRPKQRLRCRLSTSPGSRTRYHIKRRFCHYRQRGQRKILRSVKTGLERGRRLTGEATALRSLMELEVSAGYLFEDSVI